MENKKITILLTGIGGTGYGGQILKALRLSSLKHIIIGTDMSHNCSNFSMVDHTYTLPAASNPNYLSELLTLCKKYNVQALLHGSEPELKVISANRELFENQNIFLPISSNNVINICMDKVRTTNFLKEHGFNYPIFAKITSIEDAANFSTFPAVLKPSVGGGGSAMTTIVQNKAEAKFAAQQILQVYSECIMQEYIGTPDDEYTVGVLTDMQGNIINSIVLHRFIMSALSNRIKVPNRSNKTKLGPVLAISSGISQGWIGKHEKIQEVCEDIALKLGSTGAINIQCRFVNGEVIPFEINPRFSGTTSLRAMVGYNEPEVLIRREVFGEEIQKHFPYSSGIITRSLTEHLIPDII